jgi:hypothetical protein
LVLDQGVLQAVPSERYIPEWAQCLLGLSDVVRVSFLTFRPPGSAPAAPGSNV